MLKIQVDDNLARALSALANAERGTQEAMRQAAAAEINKVWSPALLSKSSTPAERKLLAGGSSAEVTPAGFTLTAGAGTALSGGLTGDSWAAIEFGMTPKQIVAKNRQRTIRIAGSGRQLRIASTIWVGRNLPSRRRDGRVVFPTARTHGPQFVEAWIKGLIGQFTQVDGTALDVKKV